MSIEIRELIAQLRTDLSAAMQDGADSDVRFEIGPVELELTVEVDRETKPGGRIRFWVVDVGAERSSAKSTTQRIKLSLDPRHADQPYRRLHVAGEEAVGEESG